MDEAEWLASTDPATMLTFARDGASARKLRLFGCACCRQVWNPFVPAPVVRAVELMERFADGGVSDAVRERVSALMTDRLEWEVEGPLSNETRYFGEVFRAAAVLTLPGGFQAGAGAARFCLIAIRDWSTEGEAEPAECADERAAQADLVRDIFGNPFRGADVDPAWLTSDVLALANQMYESRVFGAMPILADALQDAGCDDEDVLAHCREAREHARGCWVVDSLLGKK